MKEIVFYDGIEQLSNFFNKTLSSFQKDLYFESLKDWMSDNEFNFTIKSMLENNKPNKSNFPTVKDLQSYGTKPKPQHKHDETDEEYYGRINVNDLWTAFNILKDKGHEQFMRYCHSMHFSDSDIDSVECKFKMSYKTDYKTMLKGISETADKKKRLNGLQNQARESIGE